MVEEIQAKSILIPTKAPSHWFGVKYIMNIYKGCQHGCIYCDSRSECYQIKDFDSILVKINSVELLRKELSRKRVKGTIGTGAMSDPYIPIERNYRLIRNSLKAISEFKYPVHITTKSNLILRDTDILQEINKIYASVAITITTADNILARKLEPLVTSPLERFKTIGTLSTLGINVGITMMPILPFIEDNEDNILKIVDMANAYGVKYIYPFFGVTLRDRQRDYYYLKLNEFFPGVMEKYQVKYRNDYSCKINNYERIKYIFYERCARYGISTKMPYFNTQMTATQISFLDNIN